MILTMFSVGRKQMMCLSVAEYFLFYLQKSRRSEIAITLDQKLLR